MMYSYKRLEAQHFSNNAVFKQNAALPHTTLPSFPFWIKFSNFMDWKMPSTSLSSKSSLLSHVVLFLMQLREGFILSELSCLT